MDWVRKINRRGTVRPTGLPLLRHSKRHERLCILSVPDMRTSDHAHTVNHRPDVAALTVSIAPAIASSFAAIVVAYVAWQQWRTARHKLAVDLFDRRLAAYRALNNAIGTRHNEILALTFEQVTRDPPTAALREFWAASQTRIFSLVHAFIRPQNA